MDFFQHQESARRKTGLLVFYFLIAVVLIVLLVYTILVAAIGLSGQRDASGMRTAIQFWNPGLFGSQAPRGWALDAQFWHETRNCRKNLGTQMLMKRALKFLAGPKYSHGSADGITGFFFRKRHTPDHGRGPCGPGFSGIREISFR